MLTNALRALVNNLFKESFYEKKKNFNVLTVFSFLIKIVSKLSWNELLTNALRALVSMTQFNKVHPNTPGIGAHC